jgi:hypothetical protein
LEKEDSQKRTSSKSAQKKITQDALSQSHFRTNKIQPKKNTNTIILNGTADRLYA